MNKIMIDGEEWEEITYKLSDDVRLEFRMFKRIPEKHNQSPLEKWSDDQGWNDHQVFLNSYVANWLVDELEKFWKDINEDWKHCFDAVLLREAKRLIGRK